MIFRPEDVPGRSCTDTRTHNHTSAGPLLDVIEVSLKRVPIPKDERFDATARRGRPSAPQNTIDAPIGTG